MTLRVLLCLALAAASAVPIAIFGIWAHGRALDSQLAQVEDRHLPIAVALSGTLDRYARDVRSTVMLAAAETRHGVPSESLARLLGDLHLRYVALLDPRDGTVLQVVGPRRRVSLEAIRHEILAAALPGPEPGTATATARDPAAGGFTPVLPGLQGEPTIYLVQWLGDVLAIGALDLTFFAELGTQMRFGGTGHVVIADETGRPLYHPVGELVRERLPLSSLLPLCAALGGATGTAQFDPVIASQGPMVAGYAPVRETGWAVLVAQPVAELEQRAAEMRNATFGVLAAAVLAAALASWLLSGLLVRPVQAVTRAAAALAVGQTRARATLGSGPVPRELHALVGAFNAMAEAVDRARTDQQQALARAEQASRAKSDFLAQVSHELRTPLNAVIGFSEIISREMYGPVGDRRYREYAADIQFSGNHLLAIVNDILDVAKAEAGELAVEDGPVDIAAVAEDSLALVQQRATNAGVTLRAELQPALPNLRGDERRVRQVLLNLLSNAVKFTPSGGRITVRAARRHDGGLAISVADTGIGMDAADIARAMTPFQQVNGILARRHEGTGLGLPLSRALMELHGGSLTLDSARGRGTVATARFPASRVLRNGE